MGEGICPQDKGRCTGEYTRCGEFSTGGLGTIRKGLQKGAQGLQEGLKGLQGAMGLHKG